MPRLLINNLKYSVTFADYEFRDKRCPNRKRESHIK